MATPDTYRPIEQGRVLSKYLSAYCVEPAYLERLIAALFRDEYPHLMPGAPGGGSDLGLDIIHIGSDGKVTVWCVTTEDNAHRKLKSDATTVLRTFDRTLGELATIYLCTCRKLSNMVWRDISDCVYKERDELLSSGVAGISSFNVLKYDCDSIATDLLRPSSFDLKNEILARVRAGIEVTREDLLTLAPAVPEDEDTSDDMSEIGDETTPTKEQWSTAYPIIVRDFAAIDQSNDEGRVLLAVEAISRFVASTRSMGPSLRQQQLLPIRRKLDDLLWPDMASSWSRDHDLSRFDMRLAASFVHTNLTLKVRTGTPPLSDVYGAYQFLKENSRRLPRQLVVFKLTGLVVWLLHKNGRFDEVLVVLELAHTVLLQEMSEELLHEEYALLITFAGLYIHATRYHKGGQPYLGLLRTMFHQWLKRLDYGYWRQVLALLALIYEPISTIGWAHTRERFLSDFGKIRQTDVSTPERALAYLRLYGFQQELLGKSGLETFEEKIKLFQSFNKPTRDHPTLRIQRVLMELGAAYVAPWYQLADRFLYLEELMRKAATCLDDVFGLTVKLRFLRLFLMRVIEPRILQKDGFVERSKVVSSLLAGRGNVSLRPYFGIENVPLVTTSGDHKDAYQILKPVIRPMIFSCLSRYASTILPNASLSPAVRGRAALDYLDFLSQAEARYSEVRLSAVFRDLLETMESGASETRLFHYYLARLYRNHSIRDIPRAVRHSEGFWAGAGDFEKNRFAADYARTLYENFVYFEEQTGARDSLATLRKVCGEFLGAGSKRYFISCYHGLAINLQDINSAVGEGEERFLIDLSDRLREFRIKRDPSSRNYYRALLSSTVYTTEFHDFLAARERDSYIAASFLASLNSPEIYNAVATHLVHLARIGRRDADLFPAKLLYDIAVGLAHSDEFYLPKYEFNRVRCEITEIELSGSPKSAHDGEVLVSAISEVYRLRRSFVWANRYLKKEVCEYLYAHRDDPVIRTVIDHPYFESRWSMLKEAFRKRVARNVGT